MQNPGGEIMLDYRGPCSIEKWYERSSLKLRKIPNDWSVQVKQFKDAYNGSKLVVVFHVYYLDLVDEILESLRNIPVAFDLIVTNSSGATISDKINHLFSSINFVELKTNNRGRDILPLIKVINAELLNEYDLVFKVHTKKSEWRSDHPELKGDGAGWRAEFLSELIGSQNQVEQILRTFASDQSAGVITSGGNVLGPDFWGDNQAAAAHLLWRMQMKLEESNLSFAAGSIYWCRAFILKAMIGFDISDKDFEDELGQNNQTTAHAVERIIGLVTTEAGYRTISTLELSFSDGYSQYDLSHKKSPIANVIPFYLPQYHQVDENNLWWGNGFTEWSNVTSATPNFAGHSQPFLPSELGFYNLIDNGVREKQWDLAEKHGISAFMYYHYWFAGRKVLDIPISSLLNSKTQSPFCVMWANENWTRTWDGGEEDVLLGQNYGKVPGSEFIFDVLPLLKDSRYFKIDDKPVIAVYRVSQIPNFEEVVEQWRKICRREAIGELLILGCDLPSEMDGMSGGPQQYGLDGILEFPPHNQFWSPGEVQQASISDSFSGRIVSYKETLKRAEWRLTKRRIDDWRFPGVMVNFDNTARRQNTADIWVGSNPYSFHRWITTTILALSHREFNQRTIFLNAWNEWAEGAVLEPSVRWGRSYLQAVEAAVLR
jgi:lipopolysaccharide biosynthesis protein